MDPSGWTSAGPTSAWGWSPGRGASPLALRRLPTLAAGGGEAVVARVVEMIRSSMAEVLGSTGGPSRGGGGWWGSAPRAPWTGQRGGDHHTQPGWRNFPSGSWSPTGSSSPPPWTTTPNCATYGEWWLGAGQGGGHPGGDDAGGPGSEGGSSWMARSFHGVSDDCGGGDRPHRTIRLRPGNPLQVRQLTVLVRPTPPGPTLRRPAVEGIAGRGPAPPGARWWKGDWMPDGGPRVGEGPPWRGTLGPEVDPGARPSCWGLGDGQHAIKVP